MERQKSVILSGLFNMLMFLLPLSAYSQVDTISSYLKTDSINHFSEVSHHALYTGIGYGSNMIYMGSTISHNQPFGCSAISYGYNDEFYVTVSAIHLSDVEPFVSFYTGSLNYIHVFNSWFDISSGVYRYQVASSLADTLLRNFTYGDFALGIDWRLVYSKFSVGALLSDNSMVYLQMRNSRYFKTAEFSRKKFYISFDPYINLLTGTRIKGESISETYSSVSSTSQMVGSISQNSTSNNGTTVTNKITDITYSRGFGLLEIDFGIPVSLNSDRISIEADASYVLPLYDDPYFPGPKGFVFTLSGFLRIF